MIDTDGAMKRYEVGSMALIARIDSERIKMGC